MEGLQFVACPLSLLSLSPLTSFLPHSGFGTGRMTTGHGSSLDRSVKHVWIMQLCVFNSILYSSPFHSLLCNFFPFHWQQAFMDSCLILLFRVMVTHQPLSPLQLWRTCTLQTEIQRFLLELANNSISSTSKEHQEPCRCFRRILNTKPRERSDEGLTLCLLMMWSPN